MSQPGYTSYPRAPKQQINFAVISEAFEVFRKQWVPFVAATLIAIVVFLPVAVPIYAYLFGQQLGSQNQIIDFASFLSYMVVQFSLMGVLQAALAFATAGLYNMGLKAARGQEVKLDDYWIAFRAPVQYLVAAVLTSAGMILGIFACYVGMFVVAGLLLFVFPLMVDRKMSAIDAMQTSVQMLSKHCAPAAGLYFVASMIAGIGVIACCVGLVFSLPLMYLCIAMAYRDFVDAPPVTPESPWGAPPASGYVTPETVQSWQPGTPEPASEPEMPRPPSVEEPPAEPEPPKQD